jgi:hypothetical protein
MKQWEKQFGKDAAAERMKESKDEVEAKVREMKELQALIDQLGTLQKILAQPCLPYKRWSRDPGISIALNLSIHHSNPHELYQSHPPA